MIKRYIDCIKALFAPHSADVTWLTALLCRATYHKRGVVWHNVGGSEPDMTCKSCGDDLS